MTIAKKASPAQGKDIAPTAVRVKKTAKDEVGEQMAEEIDHLLFELTQQVLTTLIELTKRAKEKFKTKDELELFSTPFSLLADRAFSLLAASDQMVEVTEG